MATTSPSLRERFTLLRPWERLLLALLALLALLVRIPSRAPLWLDESISVSIASLPLEEIPGALARDGAPPLYYYLLHFWIAAFGDETAAVRSLSTLIGVSSLPLIFLLARRLTRRDDLRLPLLVLLLAAFAPFNVYYASETRMYALVVAEVALLGLLLLRARERPTLPRLLACSLCVLALALTHYWSFFLLAALACTLAALAAWRSRLRLRELLATPELALLGALGFAGLLFLPWLPTFLFQSARTGAPWADPPELSRMLRVPADWLGAPHEVGALALLGGLVLALCWAAAIRARHAGIADLLAALLIITFGLGFAASHLTDSAYAPRYSAVAFVPALLLAALGLRRLSPRLQGAALALLLAAALPASLVVPIETQRTQAGEVAAVLAEASSGDVVLYCPDQLAPAVHRLLRAENRTTIQASGRSVRSAPPARLREITYPERSTVSRPDWVDYETRNRRADPLSFADQLDEEFGDETIWLVARSGYATYGRDCEVLAARLRLTRTIEETLRPRNFFFESAGVYRLERRAPQ